MTSTNDGKEVKSNETSSQKGKTYLIELHKSLDARLSQDCELRARSELLRSAWQQIHTLCLHSTQNTHPYLQSWIQRHTAKTVLQTEWQSPKTPDIEAIQGYLEDGINHFIQECETAAQSRTAHPWESQLLERAQWFKSVLRNPWEHPVLRLLLDPRGAKPTDDEVVEWLKQEQGVMFVCRVRQLASSKSVADLALLLAAAVMDRARADQLCDDKADGEPESAPPANTFMDTLTKEAGFTEDVWELLIDIEFVLLHKNDRRDKCIERAKQTPLSSATKLVERLQNRLSTSPREKKLWKNAKEVAILIAQVVMARCMVVPTCAGSCRAALRGAARALCSLLPAPRLAAAAAALAAPAATARHLHSLARAVDAQCGGDRKSFVCELYVRAITAGMNELEQLKFNKTKDLEARAAEQTLAAWFTQLGFVLTSSARIQCECILTAFSVHPSPLMYERIKALPQLQKSQEQTQEQQEATSEFGSWANDSRSQTNFVKTSETLNIKQTHQGNVLSTALLSEGEALGLAPELCQDLAVLLSGPRIKTLSWEMDREELLENCRTHMERTGCGTRALTTELKYLNLDPKKYQHLPEEEEDADDMYYGIEKGYEHLVEFQDSPPPVATTWQHASDFEQTQSDPSADSDFDVPKRRSKKKTKKQIQSSSDENEPQSLAELKELKKKERPHSKERSQERKTKKHSQIKECKKERKKEKKQRKKNDKPMQGTHEAAYSSSLAQLIGLQTSPIYLNERPLHVPLPRPSNDPLCPSTFNSGYNAAFLAHLQAQNSGANETSNKEPPKPKQRRVRTMQTKIRNHVGQHVATPRNLSPMPHSVSPTPRHSLASLRHSSQTPRHSMSPIRHSSFTIDMTTFKHSSTYGSSTSGFGSSTPRHASSSPRTGSPLPNLKARENEILQTVQKPISDEVKQSITRLIEFRRPKTSTSIANTKPATIVTDAARVQALQDQMRFLLKHELTTRPVQQNAGPSNSQNPQESFKHQDKTSNSEKTDKSTDFFDEFMKSLQATGYSVKSPVAPKKSLKPISKMTPLTTPSTSITNTPTASIPCAKPVMQQKKVDNAPNTFARRSYMHKNKQEHSKIKLTEPKDTSLDNAKPHSELDRLMSDQKLTKLKQPQSKGFIANQNTPKVDVKKNTTLQSKAESTNLTIQSQTNIRNTKAQNIATQHANVNSTAHDTPSSMLSRNDQAELLMLLRQQNKLNAITNSQSLSDQNQPVFSSSNNLSYSSLGPAKPTTSMFGIACYKPASATATKPQSSSQDTITINASIDNTETIKQTYSGQATQSKHSGHNILKKKSTKQLKTGTSKKGRVSNKPKTDKPNIPVTNRTKSKDVLDKTDKLRQFKKPENWECVLDQLLAQKTPNRETDWGPNALDMALKKDTFKKPESKLSKAVPEKVKTDQPVTIPCASVNTAINKILPIKPSDVSQKEKVFVNHLSKKEDPFISEIPKSDYDLLEELMDEDLRKEIGEISSDEEGYSETLRKPVKTVVSKQNVEKTAKETAQTLHLNNIPSKTSNLLVPNTSSRTKSLVSNTANETQLNANVIPQEKVITAQNKRSQNTNIPTSVNSNIVGTAVPQGPAVQNMLLIRNDIIYNPFSSIQVRANSGYVIPSTYVAVNNTSNVNFSYQAQQINVSSPTNPIILGQTVTIPVQTNISTYSPLQYNDANYHSSGQLSSSIPTAQNVNASNMPTPEDLLAAIVQDSIQPIKNNGNTGTVNFEPKVRYDSNFDAQKKPIHPNKKIIKKIECIKESTASDINTVNQERVKINDGCKKRQLNATPNIKTDKTFNGLDHILNEKPVPNTQADVFKTDIKLNSDILSSKDRKVLSEVQEKLTCVISDKTELKLAFTQKTQDGNTDIIINQERLKQKRLAILNRQISHKSCQPCIPLHYASLKNTVTVLDPISIQECIEDNGDLEDHYVLTPDSQDDVENKSQEVEPSNNDLEPVLTCRRILLRSSYKLKEKNTTSSVTDLKKTRNLKIKTNAKERRVISTNNKESLKLSKHSTLKDTSSKPSDINVNSHIGQDDSIVKKISTTQVCFKSVENILDTSDKVDYVNTIYDTTNTESEELEIVDAVTEVEIPILPERNTVNYKINDGQTNTVLGNSLISRLRNKITLENKNITVDKLSESMIIPIEDSDDSLTDNETKKSSVDENVVQVEDSDDSCTGTENNKKTLATLTTREVTTYKAVFKASCSDKSKESLGDFDIHIEDITTDSTNPNIKVVRLKLPNRKSLKATIIGSQTVNFDTILNDPAIKKIVYDTINGCNLKQQIVKQIAPVSSQKFSSFKVVDTVDLLSDEESENNTFNTEFGIFKVTNFNSEDHDKHQRKLNKECSVKLKRFGLNSVTQLQPTVAEHSEKDIEGNTTESTIEITAITKVLNQLQGVVNAIVNKDEPDVIEIDDSSTDEESKSINKINEYKNLLLSDLQIKRPGRTRQQKCNLVSEVQNCPDHKLDRKCYVKLVRCDSSKPIEIDTSITAETIESDENSSRPSSRNSFSILDDVPVLLEVDENISYQGGRTSPVMEMFEIILNSPNILNERSIQQVHKSADLIAGMSNCECEYLLTKRMFSLHIKKINEDTTKINKKIIKKKSTEEIVHEVTTNLNSKLDERCILAKSTDSVISETVNCNCEYFQTKQMFDLQNKKMNKDKITINLETIQNKGTEEIVHKMSPNLISKLDERSILAKSADSFISEIDNCNCEHIQTNQVFALQNKRINEDETTINMETIKNKNTGEIVHKVTPNLISKLDERSVLAKSTDSLISETVNCNCEYIQTKQMFALQNKIINEDETTINMETIKNKNTGEIVHKLTPSFISKLDERSVLAKSTYSLISETVNCNCEYIQTKQMFALQNKIINEDETTINIETIKNKNTGEIIHKVTPNLISKLDERSVLAKSTDSLISETVNCNCEYIQTKQMFALQNKKINEDKTTMNKIKNKGIHVIVNKVLPSLTSIITRFINTEESWGNHVARSKRKLPAKYYQYKITKINDNQERDKIDSPCLNSNIKIKDRIRKTLTINKKIANFHDSDSNLKGKERCLDQINSQNRELSHQLEEEIAMPLTRTSKGNDSNVVSTENRTKEQNTQDACQTINSSDSDIVPEIGDDLRSGQRKKEIFSSHDASSLNICHPSDQIVETKAQISCSYEITVTNKSLQNDTKEISCIDRNEPKIYLNELPVQSEVKVTPSKVITESDEQESCAAPITISQDHDYAKVSFEDADVTDIQSCAGIVKPRVTILRDGDKEIVLNGVEIEHPDIGTRYYFPIDDINSNDELIEVVQEIFDDDTYVLSENELDDVDLSVVLPKNTYSRTVGNLLKRRRLRKRKIEMSDFEGSVKKYRKSKNIDIPKLSPAAIKDFAYSADYKRILDYMTSVKFSYNSPFHKEYIDVPDLLRNWPNIVEINVQYENILDFKHLIFDELENEAYAQRLDPMKLTLMEELNSNYNDKDYPCSDQETTNFHMGFGDGSDRVLNKSKDDGNISAATLSDVKQSQPLILFDKHERLNYKIEKSQEDEFVKMTRYINFIQLKDKVRNFFEKTSLAMNMTNSKLTSKAKPDNEKGNKNLFQELCEPDFIEPHFIESLVNVVQVGQLPVSAAAQNPVTCDPRVTQVSDASPSQCSIENSSNDDSQSGTKTEYTELTTAELTNLPLMANYTEQCQVMSLEHENVTYMHGADNVTQIQDLSHIQSSENTPNLHNSESLNHMHNSENEQMQNEINSDDNGFEAKQEVKEEEVKENHENVADNHALTETNNHIHIEYTVNTNNSTINNASSDNALFNVIKREETNTSTETKHQNRPPVVKPDQLAFAMNAAGITTTPDPSSEPMNNSRGHLVNILSHKLQNVPTTTQASTNNFTKTTSINTMALQQALAQILPQALTHNAENNQNVPMAQQVLHIVQSKNGSGNQITLLDNSQQSVINNQNTPVLHIVQNKGAPIVSNSGTANVQHTNSFSGLSLVDTGLQQGGNQLLQIVNTGNQKNNNAGQVLKRVNLLTNLTNMQGSNEQKMVQFVCKSADGKSIQLNAPHQRSMVLRLQPIETSNMQTTPPKTGENEETASGSNNQHNKETNSQQEIKSRSVYEENYAKFIQNTTEKPAEKPNSLPKFNQAFGKPLYQEGNQKPNEINTNTSSIAATSNNTSKSNNNVTSENNMNIDPMNQINSPPLLLKKSPTQAPQAQPNLVQQIKQTIAPMNIQTMHGGVIYTRQIPVNIGGGQTINLITVPSTELVDDQNQKTTQNQSEIEPSIIKIVPQGQTAPPNAEASTDENKSAENNSQNPQPQPVLTQMRIKLPMLSKAPNVVTGTRVVRPSFFQIQRNVIGGANQPVYQQLVLTTAPPLGQQTIRLPQTQTRPIKVQSENSSSSEAQMSSSTLEQLREFDMVLEQVKERSTVQPNGSSASSFNKIRTTSTDTTDSSVSASSTSTEPTQQVLYSISNNQSLNLAYVTRKSTANTPTTSTFSRSPDSSGIADSPSSSAHTQALHSATTESSSSEASAQHKPAKVSSKSRSRPKSSSHPSSSSVSKVNLPPKTSTSSSAQKPLEDEQTTQRILYILAEYKEQVENSPDKDKPAPRRRTNPPSNPGSSKRKKSGSRRSGGRDSSPVQGDDNRTMGSEDSSCGTSQGDCTENCLDSHSPQDSPRKVARKLTFDQDTAANQARPQPQRNVIVADGQTITMARGTAGKPTTAVLMPANYILPVSMVKGGQQIAIVTNRGPKLLTVGGGEAGTTNALLLQRLIGPAGLKPVLRPGVRHVRLPTAALHNLQAFNLSSTATVNPTDSAATSAPAPTPPVLIDTRTSSGSSPWTERDNQDPKPERGSSPEGSEPWNVPSSAEPQDYCYEETVRTDNLDRTVLVVHRKDGSAQRHHRLTHVSAAALRHKYAILEHELRLQKSLSEECEDLGVDSPSAAELFPEAELLFAASPAQQDHANSDNAQRPHTPPAPPIASSVPLELEEQIVHEEQVVHEELVEQIVDEELVESPELLQLGLPAIDHEEFARSHPNTTFHSEPTEDDAQPFTITGLKGRHITSTIFHAGRAPPTVLMSAPQTTVISQASTQQNQQQAPQQAQPVKYADIDNMINSLPSVLVKDDRLTRYDNILSDRELHLSTTPSAIVTHNATQVIRRVRYEKETRQFLLDDPDAMMGDKLLYATRDSTLEDRDDGQSSPERHTELFWESNSERSDSRRPLDYSSDSDKCCKSPSLDETNSTDSSGNGAHTRLDSVIKDARIDRYSAESSAEDTHPPLRTYPPKRMYHNDRRESLSGKTRAGESSPDSLEVRRRASLRGVVKRGCHCCNGSPAPSRPKKPRQRKPNQDFTN